MHPAPESFRSRMEPPEALVPREYKRLAPPEPSATLLLRRDRALMAILVLALLINMALLVFLAVRFEALPDLLPLHFDASGLPDRIDAKAGIFGLPIIGLIVLVANALIGFLVHRRERAAARLFASSALLMQILLWLAAMNIVGGLV